MIKFFLLIVLSSIIFVSAQTKKDGTPDMRYKANKQAYGTTYNTTPSYNYFPPQYSQPKPKKNYPDGGKIVLQNGYIKKNGTYVESHLKTTPDNNEWNNLKKSWEEKYK